MSDVIDVVRYVFQFIGGFMVGWWIAKGVDRARDHTIERLVWGWHGGIMRHGWVSAYAWSALFAVLNPIRATRAIRRRNDPEPERPSVEFNAKWFEERS